MTLAEFEGRRKVESECGDYFVISVADHKTAALYGSARVIVLDEIATLISTYIVSYCNITLGVANCLCGPNLLIRKHP